jgi:hypothetical protein
LVTPREYSVKHSATTFLKIIFVITNKTIERHYHEFIFCNIHNNRGANMATLIASPQAAKALLAIKPYKATVLSDSHVRSIGGGQFEVEISKDAFEHVREKMDAARNVSEAIIDCCQYQIEDLQRQHTSMIKELNTVQGELEAIRYTLDIKEEPPLPALRDA